MNPFVRYIVVTNNGIKNFLFINPKREEHTTSKKKINPTKKTGKCQILKKNKIKII